MVPRVWYIAAGFLGYAGLWCLYIVIAWRVCKWSPTTLGGRILEYVFVVPLGLPVILFHDWLVEPFKRHRWPRTKREAVKRLVQCLERRTLDSIAALPKDEITVLHFSVGLYVRNESRLWQGNTDLLADCGTDCADDARVPFCMNSERLYVRGRVRRRFRSDAVRR